jgi:heme/copper-type cytochrome/quinol oxidase subunit 3
MSSDTTSHTEFHIHHDAPAVVGRRERLGVRLLIVADGAFVVGMIFSYFYLRGLNANNSWVPKGGHTLAASTGWVIAAPLIAAAIVHKIGVKSRSAVASGFVLLAMLVGGYLQWKQLAHMPFVAVDDGGRHFFEGAYASNWVVLAGANMFHYIIGAFIALGLFIRGFRAKVDPTLEYWRQLTASSWFTWIAIAGALCAITTSIV